MGANLFGSAASILFAQEDFIGSTMFFVIMGALLVGLGGLLYYLRKKESDE
jgi:LPXTG-motif cell wall-anchored protein